MPFHSRKVTLRFTAAEYALLAFATSRMPSRWRKATVSKFLRAAARDKIAAMGISEADLKTSDSGPLPSSKRTVHTVKH